MTKEKMTVHQALCELKVLDNRIMKKIDEFCPCVANRNSNARVDGKTIDDFKSDENAKYMSIVDLINRRYAIKRAVTRSNAKTEVEIGGITYTVAEAIEMRNHGIGLKNSLLTKMDSTYTMATLECNSKNIDLADKATEYVSKTFNGGEKVVKNSDLQERIDEYIKNNTYSIVECINVTKKMTELEDEISRFNIDVDSKLSVSNAITEIEIEY